MYMSFISKLYVETCDIIIYNLSQTKHHPIVQRLQYFFILKIQFDVLFIELRDALSVRTKR
jgi:hypothetical protein